jgi:hypothetical protein
LSLSPQQATAPFDLTPHVWQPPALTEVNVPVGAALCPWSISPTAPGNPAPQQATVPSVFSPHVCAAPALTATKFPSGAVASFMPFSPQQAMVPFDLTPHV